VLLTANFRCLARQSEAHPTLCVEKNVAIVSARSTIVSQLGTTTVSSTALYQFHRKLATTDPSDCSVRCVCLGSAATISLPLQPCVAARHRAAAPLTEIRPRCRKRSGKSRSARRRRRCAPAFRKVRRVEWESCMLYGQCDVRALAVVRGL